MKNTSRTICFVLTITIVLFFMLFIWLGRASFGKEFAAKRLYNKAIAAMQNNPDEAGSLLTELINSYPGSGFIDDAHMNIGDILLKKDMLLEAKKHYGYLVSNFPNSDLVGLAQQRLGDVNIKLLFSPIITPQDKSYKIQEGDTLDKIAKENHTTVELLKYVNGLSTDKIKPGMRLKVSQANYSIVIDKSQNTLTLRAGEELIKIYRVSTGANNSTPIGTFKIINKIVNPTWYKAGAVVPPDSPENILGSRWMGISKPGFGIHGTTDPSSIGMQVTAGCVRLTNQDVEELFTMLPIETEVTIVD